MDSDIGATATLVQQQHQTLDGNHHPGQKEQDHVNGTVASAEGHAVDRFRGEAGCSAKEIAVVAPDNDSVGDSSTQCSDVIDDDNEEEETDVEESGAGGWIMNPPVSTIVQQHQAFDTTNGYIALPNSDSSNFSDVRVKDSRNVHLGNEVNYNGPVTIHVNHVVYTNSSPTQDASKLDASVSNNTSNLSTNKDNGEEDPNEVIFPQNTKLNKVTQWLWTWKRAVLSCVLTLILLVIAVPITVHFTRHSDALTTTPAPTTPFSPTTPLTTPTPTTPTTPTTPEIPNSSIEGNNGTEFRIVERDEWRANPPSEPIRKMKLPVPYVIICQTGSNYCTKLPECAYILRYTQDYYMKQDYPDIGYNFLVGGDGLAYVGRSWDYMGGHSGIYNDISIGIAFLGDFTSVVPPKTQLNAAQKLIEFGVGAGKIAPDYILLGRRQVLETGSTGDVLYNEIKNWPHWSPQPYGNNGTEFRIVERDEWRAWPPSEPIRKMKLPVPYVIICHTGSNYCTTLLECAFVVRFTQDYYMKQDYPDIGYNFLVGGDGLAYVGRSWDYMGGHSEIYNDISIGIAFMGNFTSVVPLKTQLNAAQKLIEFGVGAGKIAPDYKLLGRRQVLKTDSTAGALYNEIKNWPHWSSEP